MWLAARRIIYPKGTGYRALESQSLDDINEHGVCTAAFTRFAHLAILQPKLLFHQMAFGIACSTFYKTLEQHETLIPRSSCLKIDKTLRPMRRPAPLRLQARPAGHVCGEGMVPPVERVESTLHGENDMGCGVFLEQLWQPPTAMCKTTEHARANTSIVQERCIAHAPAVEATLTAMRDHGTCQGRYQIPSRAPLSAALDIGAQVSLNQPQCRLWAFLCWAWFLCFECRNHRSQLAPEREV